MTIINLLSLDEPDGVAPAAFGHLTGHEISLSPANEYNRANVRICVDWPDYGPLADGLPMMHYRLKMSRCVGAPTRDERSQDVAEVKRFIWEAFGWSNLR